MSLNASNVRVAGTGEVYVAAVGVTAISSITAAIPSASWTGLGYTSEDGVTIARERDTEDINAWQSSTPVRKLTTSQSLTVSTAFLETKKRVLELWFGGSFSGAAGDFKNDLSVTPQSTEVALLVEWVDDTTKSRLFVPRVTVTDQGDVELTRTGAQQYEMTFEALAPASGPLATWLTNDTSVGAA